MRRVWVRRERIWKVGRIRRIVWVIVVVGAGILTLEICESWLIRVCERFGWGSHYLVVEISVVAARLLLPVVRLVLRPGTSRMVAAGATRSRQIVTSVGRIVTASGTVVMVVRSLVIVERRVFIRVVAHLVDQRFEAG